MQTISNLRRRLAVACLISFALATPARAVIEEQYNQDTAGPPETTWYVAANPAAQAVDRAYVSGMRPHHAGALTMSQDYLADPQSSSPVLRALARAIIRNQTFEIALLDAVAADLARPPMVVPLGFTTLRLQPVADEGWAQKSRFFRSPMPSLLDALSNPAARVTERDVAFAKGMTMHHQAAVDMARDYHANPAARNGFLGLMNIDIERDQTQEIGLMQSVIHQYAGNPDTVIVNPATVHGMEGMNHGGHGATTATSAPAPAPHDHGRQDHPSMATPNTPASPPSAATPTPAARGKGQANAPKRPTHEGHQH